MMWHIWRRQRVQATTLLECAVMDEPWSWRNIEESSDHLDMMRTRIQITLCADGLLVDNETK